MITISVTTMAWSLMPGTEVDVFTIEGLLVKIRSSMLLSLVGWLCICVRSCSIERSFCVRSILTMITGLECGT